MSEIIVGKVTASSTVGLPVVSGGASNYPSPYLGAMIYDADDGFVYVSNGTDWIKLGGGLGNDGSSSSKAAASVQELYDAGQTADGLYYLNINGQVNQFFVPLASHPGYILVASWGGGAAAFMSSAAGITGNDINTEGSTTATGNFASNSTYGYYRNASGSDFKYASFSNYGIAYRYIKVRFNLYNYYSNDGVTSRNFLNISSSVGDGLTIMRNNSSAGDGQHIFTYYTAISNNDGNSCPSVGGMSPTHTQAGNNPGSFMGNRYCCFSRSGSSYTSEYVRNFTPLPGDSSGGTGPNSFTGDSWYTIDLGTTYNDPFHCVIHSDQDSGNEDTYLKRGCVMIKGA